MTLTFGGSVLLALFLGSGRGAAPAGSALQVHRHRVLRAHQGGVPVPAGSVPQVGQTQSYCASHRAAVNLEEQN